MTDARLQFSLGRDAPRPLVLSIEPWGEDYTFRSDAVVEIVATGAAWFHVHVAASGVYQVYLEGDVETFQVLEGGVPVQCGHGR
jgi:hypothetical protein